MVCVALQVAEHSPGKPEGIQNCAIDSATPPPAANRPATNNLRVRERWARTDSTRIYLYSSC